MATSSEKKARDQAKVDLVAKLSKLFKIPPVEVEAEDGSGAKITIEHKIGRVGGYHTLRGLMEKLGLEAEHSQFIQGMIKQIKNPDERKKIIDVAYVQQKKRANKVISEYRKELETIYGNAPRPLIPAFTFVPVKTGEDGLYFQGLVWASNRRLVIGNPEEVYRAIEKNWSKTKKWADIHRLAEEMAAGLLKHPGINKDLRQRLHAIGQGEIPPALGFSG